MRSTYYMVFSVYRLEGYNLYHDIENAKAYMFVRDHDAYSAFIKSSFYSEKIGWGIKEVLLPPVSVDEKSFIDKEFHSPYLRNAEKEGLSFLLRGESDSYKVGAEIDMVNEKPSDPSVYYSAVKEAASRKVCLHFGSGEDCDEIIKAHSIQKSRSLKAIAKNGHVYRMSNKIVDGGVLRFKKQGVEKASTFYGFCKKHDNDLFESIDNYDFSCDVRQVSLYAYRSICREVYVKQNSLSLAGTMLNANRENHVIERFAKAWKLGVENGVKSLLSAKRLFDEALQNETYDQIEYVVFSFSGKPTIHFSGLMYPQFDFSGGLLQDLADLEKELSLVTFCSAPTEHGWDYIFSWHKLHAEVGRTFLGSLANYSKLGGKLEDALFRLAIFGCENFALSPTWWEGLSSEIRDEVEWRFAHIGGPMSAPDPHYLMTGLEGISSWECETVRSSF